MVAWGQWVSHSSVSFLQLEVFTELLSVRPPREVRLGGHISETRQGIFPSHIPVSGSGKRRFICYIWGCVHFVRVL